MSYWHALAEGTLCVCVCVFEREKERGFECVCSCVYGMGVKEKGGEK